jgi:threonine dehydratase
MRESKNIFMNLSIIREAHKRIKHYIHHTPLMQSSCLNSQMGAQFYFKCENFQRGGVFKVRGAFNALLSLSETEAAHGIVSSSSGNHAAAISLAAKTRGIPAYIAMPKIALPSKIAAVRRYGGNIVWVESKEPIPTAHEYDKTVADIQLRTGASIVHPYNDLRTIAGQGTCMLEFLADQPDLDLVLVPVGGGGLLSGVAVAAKEIKPTLRVIGCEPLMADDARRSFYARQIIEQLQPRTIADGLRTSLGDLTFPLILRAVDDIVTVSEEAIIDAMRLIWEIFKIVIEPSSAVPFAAILEEKVEVRGKSVGIILSGGNVDLDHLPWLKS